MCSHGLYSYGLSSCGYRARPKGVSKDTTAPPQMPFFLRIVMAYVVMAYVVMAYVVMAYAGMAYGRYYSYGLCGYGLRQLL